MLLQECRLKEVGKYPSMGFAYSCVSKFFMLQGRSCDDRVSRDAFLQAISTVVGIDHKSSKVIQRIESVESFVSNE